MNKRRGGIEVSFIAFFIIMVVISLFIGTYEISVKEIFRILKENYPWGDRSALSVKEIVIMKIRLPRIILAVLVGINLSVGGAVFQAIFRNHLVSPYLLGVSNGAALGASSAVVFFSTYNLFVIQSLSFMAALGAVFLTILVSTAFGKLNNMVIVLAGVVVSSLLGAIVSMMEFFTDPETLRTIFIWKLGSFSRASWLDVILLAPITALMLFLILRLSWRIDAIALGDENAIALGINPGILKMILILLVTLSTSMSVCFAGPIGWCGIIIPNMVKFMNGNNNFRVTTGSAILGAGFLLMIDFFARNLMEAEIPIGILTSIIGAVFFIIMIARKKEE